MFECREVLRTFLNSSFSDTACATLDLHAIWMNCNSSDRLFVRICVNERTVFAVSVIVLSLLILFRLVFFWNFDHWPIMA